MTEHLTARDILWAVSAAFVILVGSWLIVTALFAIAGRPL